VGGPCRLTAGRIDETPKRWQSVPAPAIEARLEPDAIGVAQDTVTGMASSAPAGTMAATLAAASAYGSGPVLVLTALPMLIIADSYRRLNPWSANCGASR